MQQEQFLARLETALKQGCKLVQLRAPGLDEGAYQTLALSAVSLCGDHGARLLLNSPPEWVAGVGAAGVHLNSRRLMALKERPLPEEYLVAASCHNREELQRAESINGRLLPVLSPVMVTASHPEAHPIGWQGFSEMIKGVFSAGLCPGRDGAGDDFTGSKCRWAGGSPLLGSFGFQHQGWLVDAVVIRWHEKVCRFISWNTVFLIDPVTQVDQSAALTTERA